MKKFFAMFAIAGVLVACNDSSNNTTNADTTVVDSTNLSTPVITDTTNTMDTSNRMNVVDTTKAVDTTK